MKLRFTKMHGLGNDFVMIDAISQQVRLTPERARAIADRNFGVGCDQVLVVQAPEHPDADFRYRIFNSDGNEVENCGNGARCFALFVRQRQLTGRKTICVETAGGLMTLRVQDNDQVSVDMGVPRLAPQDVPFEAPQAAPVYPLNVAGQQLEISAVSMGNPHAVTVVEDLDLFPVTELGPQVGSHPLFAKGANAGFMEVLDRQTVKLRVYERGAGETLACGTGACAAVVAGRLRDLLDAKVAVQLPGGTLTVEWQGEGQPVVMTGPATTVFHGQIKI
jgi:diaminopimelate epimerase